MRRFGIGGQVESDGDRGVPERQVTGLIFFMVGVREIDRRGLVETQDVIGLGIINDRSTADGKHG
ncbi:hypothetical protein D3C81_1928190 [compost metagenome]